MLMIVIICLLILVKLVILHQVMETIISLSYILSHYKIKGGANVCKGWFLPGKLDAANWGGFDWIDLVGIFFPLNLRFLSALLPALLILLSSSQSLATGLLSNQPGTSGYQRRGQQGGSCFSCGSFQHWRNQCPFNSKSIQKKPKADWYDKRWVF
jgi:hypothetical protein